MARMSRTTIMADDHLLDELRQIAKDEGMSLGEVIRQGLEWRARTRRRVPSFIGAIESGYSDTSERVDELLGEYIRAKHARR
jgi:metal-responsive CopG/Arc/MetJ family transcriptional regulator